MLSHHVNEQKRTSGAAIAALILGFISLLGGFIFTGIPALILGYNGRAQVHRSNGEIGGLGMAWTGIIIGWAMVGLSIVAAIAFFLFFFAKPTYTTTRGLGGSATSHNLKTRSLYTLLNIENFPSPETVPISGRNLIAH